MIDKLIRKEGSLTLKMFTLDLYSETCVLTRDFKTKIDISVL